MEKNYICEINGVKYDLKEVYELLIEWGYGEQAQAYLREEIGLKATPAWRLAEQIKVIGEIPRTFSGKMSRPSTVKPIQRETTTVIYWDKSRPITKKTEVEKVSPPLRRYTDEDYQRDLFLKQFGNGFPKVEAEQRINDWEHGRDPYVEKEMAKYRKVKNDDGDVAFVIAGFAIFFVIVILLGMMF